VVVLATTAPALVQLRLEVLGVGMPELLVVRAMPVRGVLAPSLVWGATFGGCSCRLS